MKKYLNKWKKSVLFYSVLYVIIFTLTKIVLNLFKLEYMQWIKYVSIIIIPIGIVIGTIQLLRKKKSVLVIILIVEVIFIFVFGGYLLLFLLSNVEEITYKEGKKMVKETHSFLLSNWINYYEYENIFVREANVRIHEAYDDSIKEYLYTTYYDEDRNVIYTDSTDSNKQSMMKDLTNSENYILQNNSSNEKSNSQHVKILYEKKIDDKTSIRVVNKGYILAQRLVIGVEKTTDGGTTWRDQMKLADDYIQIHSGAKFVFIDENTGFINDPGLVGTNGDNRGLLVTINGGKTFEESKIIPFDNLKEGAFYIEDIPYKENDILKIRIYTLVNAEKKYYNFCSDDNGISWRQM